MKVATAYVISDKRGLQMVKGAYGSMPARTAGAGRTAKFLCSNEGTGYHKTNEALMPNLGFMISVVASKPSSEKGSTVWNLKLTEEINWLN